MTSTSTAVTCPTAQSHDTVSATPKLDLTPIFSLPHHHLHIRPFQPTDVPSLAKNANNPLIPINMTNMFPSPYTLASAASWVKFSTQTEAGRMPQFAGSSDKWEQRLCSSYAIVWTGRGDGGEEAIGSIGLKCGNVHDIHGQSAEIGYWLGEEFWGRGWMTEVVAGFVQWVWRTFPVHGPGGTVSGNASIAVDTDADTDEMMVADATLSTTRKEVVDTKWRAKGIDRLEAGVFAWNACGSAKVLERCGFQKVGLLRGKVCKVVDGVEKRCDLEIWDLLRGRVKSCCSASVPLCPFVDQ